jgi:hypothetical protein
MSSMTLDPTFTDDAVATKSLRGNNNEFAAANSTIDDQNDVQQEVTSVCTYSTPTAGWGHKRMRGTYKVKERRWSRRHFPFSFLERERVFEVQVTSGC